MNSRRVIFLVTMISALGAGIIAWAATDWDHENLAFLACVSALAVASEFMDFSPFQHSRVSISIALIMTAGAFSGLPGVAVVASSAAAADFAAHRKPVFKATFNAGALLLSGVAFLGVLEVFSFAYGPHDWLGRVGPTILGSIVAFAVNAGLVSLVIALGNGRSPVAVWNTSFRWLAPYYVAFGLLALMLAAAYDNWEFAGIGLLLGPLALAWLAVRHYAVRVSALRSVEGIARP